MATIINTPSGSTEDSGSNMVLGVILVIILMGAVALFFIYGLPMIQNSQNPGSTNINVTVPAETTTPAK